MIKKIILLIFIIIVVFLALRIFIESSSRKPIEIIPENTKKISEISYTPEDKPKGEEIIPEEDIKEPSQAKEITTKKEAIKTEILEEIPSETKIANDSFIINKKVSWGYSASNGRTIDTIVIHSSYDALGSKPYNLDGLIDEYKKYSVAPHFLIDRKGNVYRLVDEKNIAYHAGTSKMPDGRTGVNNFSIGIEMINTKEDAYTNKQYSGLNDLIDYLEDKHKIKYVLGHQDIAPDRKTDPWNFSWNEVNSKNSIH